MTDNAKKFKKLRRSDLLELLLEVTEENETLRSENEELSEKIESKRIMLEEAGSIADASMQLSGIFNAAQDAADRYIENIKNASEIAEKTLAEAQFEAEQIKKCAEQESTAMIEQAKKRTEEIRNQTILKIQEIIRSKESLDNFVKHYEQEGI